MILLSKNSAFTMQKDCFYTPKAMILNWAELQTKRDYHPIHTKENRLL